jgi:dephospho-CoA kinase
VHRLYKEDEAVQQAVAERFGPEVLGPRGVDRTAIARIVFADAGELDWLEELLHPRVVREHRAWLHDLAELPDPPAVTVMEVPLLYETGGETRFDVVVAITAPAEVRAERRPVSDARAERLLPEEEKVRLADYAYVNDGTLEELEAFVADVVARLT